MEALETAVTNEAAARPVQDDFEERECLFGGFASRRVLGQDDGIFEIPDDFDAPLQDEVLALFQS